MEQLKDQVKNLHRMLDVRENYIEKIESKPGKDEAKNKGLLKSLIG
jgi:hypothetical protein